MKKIPSIDMKRIEKVVYDYTEGDLTHVHDRRAKSNGIYATTPEDYLAAYTKYDRSLSHKEVVESLSCLLKAEVLDEDSEHLCHLLINNPRYTRKLKLISDGSYRNNRIWFDHEKHISIRYKKSYTDYRNINLDDKTIKQQLNWMWNHYDEIYFQIPLFKSVSDVLEDIHLHQELEWI